MKINKPCKKPCKTCPYKADSIKGYFAGNDATEYFEALSRDTVIACHTRSRFGSNDMVVEATVCTGHIVAQIKSCKRPSKRPSERHPEAAEAHSQIREQDNFEALKANSLSVFNFKEHHENTYKD